MGSVSFNFQEFRVIMFLIAVVFAFVPVAAQATLGVFK
jgi:hypothetical protein